MSAILLTDLRIRGLKQCDKQFEIFDQKVKGLTIRTSPGGTKTFYLLYRFGRRNRRLTFGSYPNVSLKEARQRAQQALNEISKGIDPQFQKVKARETYEVSVVSKLVPEFIETYARRKTRTWKETDRILRKEFVSRWSRLPISEIPKLPINSALNEVVKKSGHSAANHTFAVIRRFFNWCVEQGYIDHSPCSGMKAPSRTAARERVLSDAELIAIWFAAEKMGFPFSYYIKLLILLGQRRNEVSSLCWGDLDFQKRVWNQPSSNKSQRPHYRSSE